MQVPDPPVHLDYARWICLSEPAEAELAQQCRQSFANGPRISILVPVHETPASFLEGMLDSVLSQTYGNWELCLADGAGQSKDARRLLEEYARRDPRIRVAFLAENRGSGRQLGRRAGAGFRRRGAAGSRRHAGTVCSLRGGSVLERHP